MDLQVVAARFAAKPHFRDGNAVAVIAVEVAVDRRVGVLDLAEHAGLAPVLRVRQRKWSAEDHGRMQVGAVVAMMDGGGGCDCGEHGQGDGLCPSHSPDYASLDPGYE